MRPINIQSLLNTGNVGQLAHDVGVSASGADAQRIRTLIQKVLAKHPQLQGMNVQADPQHPNGSYNFNTNTMTLGSVDPDVIGHELGHAQNLQGSPVYQKLLLVCKGLLSANAAAAPAIMLGMRSFVPDPQLRNDILNTLAGVSAAAAGPVLMEEASASVNAILNSDNKAQTAFKMLPALGSHAVQALGPMLTYQIDRRF